MTLSPDALTTADTLWQHLIEHQPAQGPGPPQLVGACTWCTTAVRPHDDAGPGSPSARGPPGPAGYLAR
ncbi:hypothetical protein [Streptomyces sp. FBKL.4005]|uniref:hypothetical protein n=1 Tax=Streptomyces sp. FBKL.4005 TaxID=2015515 RepID=UPI00117E9255|nr:hypothetical protein [Streptomyces sp. FBKL.4005]